MQNRFHVKALLTGYRPLILDGGLATELESQGYELNTRLWSADLLLNNPQAIVRAHLAYLQAGAQIITTASYQASVSGFLEAGFSREQAKAVLLSSVQLAADARQQFIDLHPDCDYPLVAASVGPYGAYLADGSEYIGNYGVSDSVLEDFHRERLVWLDQSDANLLACETIPSLAEASVLAALLETTSTPAWVSFSCRNGSQLNDGAGIEDGVRLFADHPGVLAVGVNCTSPQYISELIGRIKQTAPDKAIIVYPNSGECYQAESKDWQSPQTTFDLAQAARQWAGQGASIIGGCCRVGPGEIAAIAKVSENIRS